MHHFNHAPYHCENCSVRVLHGVIIGEMVSNGVPYCTTSTTHSVFVKCWCMELGRCC